MSRISNYYSIWLHIFCDHGTCTDYITLTNSYTI